jgi:hypothetical protein
MTWDLLQLPFDAIAIGTTVVAVVVYGIAARLPEPFPLLMRLLGVWLVITSTTLMVMTDETWWHAVTLGGAGLAAIIVIHLVQTRRKTAPVKEAASDVVEERTP